MSEPKCNDEYRDISGHALAPYGACAAVGADREENETDLDDHDAIGLCGEDHIGGCFI